MQHIENNMQPDSENKYIVYCKDNTDPAQPQVTLVNRFTNPKPAEKVLQVLESMNRRHGAFITGNELKIMHHGKVVKKWGIEPIENEQAVFANKIIEQYAIEGVWNVVDFTMRGEVTHTTKWQAFKFEDNKVETKYFSSGKWQLGMGGEVKYMDDGEVVIMDGTKLKWRVLDITATRMVLVNNLNNLRYTLERIERKQVK